MKHGLLLAAVLGLLAVGTAWSMNRPTQEPNDSAAIRALLEDLRWMEAMRFHRDMTGFGNWKITSDCDLETCVRRHREEMGRHLAEERKKKQDGQK